jgi:hypothetical protein
MKTQNVTRLLKTGLASLTVALVVSQATVSTVNAATQGDQRSDYKLNKETVTKNPARDSSKIEYKENPSYLPNQPFR